MAAFTTTTIIPGIIMAIIATTATIAIDITIIAIGDIRGGIDKRPAI